MSLAGAGKGEVEPPVLGPDHGFNVPVGVGVCQASISCSPVIRRTAVSTGLLVWLLFSAPAARAQGLPAYRPVNPVADSRTALGFEPYRMPWPGRWSGSLALDYASTIEHEVEPSARYDLDSEILRLRLRVARAVGARGFVELDAGVGGGYPGFLDGFLHWYHSLLGITLRERERRPRDAFLYQLELPDGQLLTRRSTGVFLGDVRLSAGMRHGRHLQTVATLTLPTSTAPAGYGHGVVAGGVVTTVRAPLASPLVYEGSLGLGYTPRHGDLTGYQRTTFLSGSSGLRWRFWGRQSLYANLFVHSPYYHDTTIAALDRRELSLDFGWILATRAGREWRLGLTEDLEPGGPAIDLVFRLGVTH
jgi:hypothetical protein